jgi:oligopeptide/dipeptide ABC transporter ATP-binding protein
MPLIRECKKSRNGCFHAQGEPLMAEKVLEIRGLKVTFNTPLGPLSAVRGVDLDVRAGEMTAVVGESGSGKSVSFLAAMGLLPKTATIEGSVVLDGEQLVGATPKKMRSVRGRLMSMIFQDPLSALNPVHKIGTQIAEMLRAHQSMSEKAALARAVDLLEIVGIPQPGDRALQYPHEFSGGMRQRVVIAMAIANSPKVLIADEPTTALDVTVQAQILEVIQRVQSQFGTAVVLITHDLGVVARVCEEVNVMYAGRIVERASIMDVFEQPTHPYTRGLLASLPQAGVERLVPITGFPPNMLRPPSGCAFRPRCAHAIDACSKSLPELAPIGNSMSACIRARELVAKP